MPREARAIAAAGVAWYSALASMSFASSHSAPMRPASRSLAEVHAAYHALSRELIARARSAVSRRSGTISRQQIGHDIAVGRVAAGVRQVAADIVDAGLDAAARFRRAAVAGIAPWPRARRGAHRLRRCSASRVERGSSERCVRSKPERDVEPLDLGLAVGVRRLDFRGVRGALHREQFVELAAGLRRIRSRRRCE